MLPFDGILEDVRGSGRVHSRDAAEFKPGFIGQSLRVRRNQVFSNSTWSLAFGHPESTLTLYIKPQSVGELQHVIGVAPPKDERFWSLSLTNDSRLTFRLGSIGRSVAVMRSKLRIPALAWKHVALTRGAEGLKLYLDGELEDSLPTDALGVFDTGAPFAIGDESHGFEGLLDELTMYSKRLSSEQIRQLYVSRKAGSCSVTGAGM